MENKDLKKYVVAEQVCEVLIGGAMGIVLCKTVIPKCNTIESIVVAAGSGLVSGLVGREFAKKFYKFCDSVHGTNFDEMGYIKNL